MDGHYDRDADIAWLRLDGWSADEIQVESTAHGLVERDRGSGRIVGLEYWQASTRLPADLLDALPAPPRNTVVIERQPA